MSPTMLRGILPSLLARRLQPFRMARLGSLRYFHYLRTGQIRPISTVMIRPEEFLLRRAYASAFIPKPYMLRLFLTMITGAVGFLSYKISEASIWVQDKFEIAAMTALSLGLGFIDSGSFITDLIAGLPTISSFLPSPKNRAPNPSDAVAASVLAGSDDQEDGDFERPKESERGDENFRLFIRKMLEIREILKAADLDSKYQLPRIVVIGSQSSGKSSVLERIVGHEFLPKGHNMITRRPLELTLVHSPDLEEDYGVISGSSPIKNFDVLCDKLTEMNQAVSDNLWVSDNPIELTIYSKNVPDLQLIDLPGYIQVTSKNQPPVLKEQISELCEKYIQGTNNIVLAVCPADVDLANSEALKASKRVDPRGERTIGVITKLDLVDPDFASEILRADDYPLKLGYIGVVCKSSEKPKTKLFQMTRSSPSDDLAGSEFETRYFTEHSALFGKSPVGIKSLRHVLTRTLEKSMAESMADILFHVQEELAEVKYQLKVEYNDRVINPEGYVTMLLTSLKTNLSQVSHGFSRSMIRSKVDNILQHHLMQVIDQYLIPDHHVKDDMILEERLKLAVAALTKSGIGKKTTSLLVETILKELENCLEEGALSSHQSIRTAILSELTEQLKSRAKTSAEMVENALKPYKQDIEFSAEEWVEARKNILNIMQSEMDQMMNRLEVIQKELGQKRLRKIIQYLARKSDSESLDHPAFSDKTYELLSRGKEAAELHHRIKLLRRKKDDLEGNATCLSPYKQDVLTWFSSILSWFNSPDYPSKDQTLMTSSPCLKLCPEIYLYMIHDRLMRVSSLFLHHSLVHEFLEPLAHTSSLLESGCESSQAAAASRLVQGTFDRSAAMELVRENPVVARHIHLLERRRALERAREKLVYLKQRRDDKTV